MASSHFPTSTTPDDEDISWTDALPICQHSGIGSHQNQSYKADGSRTSHRESEDFFCHFRTDDARTYLYAIFDGYDGKKVASFAHQRLPAELLLSQLEGQTEDSRVKAILRQAILTVERSYFESIDGLLAQRAMLTMMLPEGFYGDRQPQSFQHQEEWAKLKALNYNLRGGTAVIVALLHHQKLYVANVGDCRALHCIQADDGSLEVVQVSVDHSLRNDDEVLRLEQLGLATNTFQGEPLFGDSNATRTIGNYAVKGGYRDNPELRVATREPVIADPDIIGGLDTTNKIGFLVMFTHGFWQALEAATGTTQVDRDIAELVKNEFSQQGTLSSVAQAVVDRVVRMHHDAFINNKSGNQKQLKWREDITLIVRNFNYPLGHGIHLYIPPRDANVSNQYLETPIYDPPSFPGELPLDHVLQSPTTPKAEPPPTTATSPVTPTPAAPVPAPRRLEDTNTSSEGSGEPLPINEKEPEIDAYVDFTEFNIALLKAKLEDMYIG